MEVYDEDLSSYTDVSRIDKLVKNLIILFSNEKVKEVHEDENINRFFDGFKKFIGNEKFTTISTQFVQKLNSLQIQNSNLDIDLKHKLKNIKGNDFIEYLEKNDDILDLNMENSLKEFDELGDIQKVKRFEDDEISFQGGNIGQGGQGQVYGGVINENKINVAIKVYKQFEPSFFQQLLLSTRIEHQNIVKVYGWSNKWFDADQSYKPVLIMERCNYSLNDPKGKTIFWNEPIRVAQEIVSGLKYMHDLDILHRDIKPSNILLRKDKSVAICDFGLIKQISENETMTFTSGTAYFKAPETRNKVSDPKKVDVYAFGKTLKVLRQSLDVNNKEVQFVIGMCELCLNSDYTKRPSFEDLYQMIETFKTTKKMKLLELNQESQDDQLYYDTMDLQKYEYSTTPLISGDMVEYKNYIYFFQPMGNSCYLYKSKDDVGYTYKKIRSPTSKSVKKVIMK